MTGDDKKPDEPGKPKPEEDPAPQGGTAPGSNPPKDPK